MANWDLLLEAERRGILPEGKKALLAEAKRRGLVPEEKKASPLPLPAELIEGVQPSYTPARQPLPMSVDPPEGGIYQGNPGWKETVHEIAYGTLPPAGAALGGVAGGGPISPVTAAAGAGTGFATGKKLAQGIDALIGYRKPPPREPDTVLRAAGRTAEDIGTGAMLEMGGQIAGKVLPVVAKGVKNFAIPPEGSAEASAVRRSAAQVKRIDREISDAVRTRYEKAVRPTVAVQRTAPQLKKYIGNARQAVETIVRNKEALTFTDEAGDIVTGKLPTNLRQFSEAIDQTKGRVFEQYDALAQEAGAQGASVSLSPIARELEAVAADPVLNDMAKGAAKYAAEQAATLAERGAYSATEAQRAIKVLNRSLDAFYKNPSPDTASRAYMDSLVVNRLRAGLDDVVEAATGQEYQALKNTYGSLKAIERDVNQRAGVDARKNVKGLIDFSDIFSGSEVVRGIMTANPATIATGVTAKTISRVYRGLNDPNRHVKAMFEDVDKALSRGARPAGAGKPPSSPSDPLPELGPMEPESPLDAPTFLRGGGSADNLLSRYDETERVARGHLGYVDPVGGQRALPEKLPEWEQQGLGYLENRMPAPQRVAPDVPEWLVREYIETGGPPRGQARDPLAGAPKWLRDEMIPEPAPRYVPKTQAEGRVLTPKAKMGGKEARGAPEWLIRERIESDPQLRSAPQWIKDEIVKEFSGRTR